MFTTTKTPWLIFLLLVTVFSCAKKDENEGPSNSLGFQINNPYDPIEDFALTSIFKDGGTLEEIYDDINGQEVSEDLEKVVDNNLDECINLLTHANDLLANHTGLVVKLVGAELKGVVEWFIDADPSKKSKLYSYDQVSYDSYADIDAFYDPDKESSYLNSFYSFLDDLSDNNDQGARTGMKEILQIGQKICQYMLDDKDKDELRADTQEMIDNLVDEDFQQEFIDIAKIMGKLLVQADYPIWLDSDGNTRQRNEIEIDKDVNLDLGDSVKGMNTLLHWVNKMMADEESRGRLNTVVREISNLFNPADTETNKTILKQLIYNVEDHLTLGGKTYQSNPLYNQSDDEIESNGELTETLRELFPKLAQLLLRSDRNASAMVDNQWAEKAYALQQMRKYLINLQFDPDILSIEKSLLDLFQYDYMGRDRTDPDADAYPLSILEHAIFTIATGLDLGFEDGGETGEIDPLAADARKEHGHGKSVGYVTLNDSLFSIRPKALLETGGTSMLSLFDMSLKPTDGEYISRSYKPFKRQEMERKRFYFNPNYSALNFLVGPAVGDKGTSDGGNIRLGNNEMNSYVPYNPTGRDETITTPWISSGIIRNCFNGEGPFYYADPNAKTVTINGKTYYEYLRPNGRIYALVNINTGAFIYPTDVGDAEDEDTDVLNGYLTPTAKLKNIKTPKKERFNRYKAEWVSDYYMIKYPLLFGNTYVTLDNSDGNLTTRTVSSDQYAGALHYKETIAENDPRRACATPLEAFFRNYQWFVSEKKIVMSIPLYLSVDLNTLGFGSGTLPLGAAFLVVEGNGIQGLAVSRKFRGNHVWAKTGKSGPSTIPGDYRMEIAASLSTDSIDLGLIGGITELLIYDIMDRGQLNPSVVAINSPAIVRLAFPRSPKMDRGSGVTDYCLGSLEFDASDDDEIWRHRSAFFPILISILSALYDNTPGYPEYKDPNNDTNIKCGGKMFLESLSPILTPLRYYQKSEGQGPYNCWKPRINGGTTPGYGSHRGEAYLQSSSDFYSTSRPLTNWYASKEEILFYNPRPLKTVLNMMIDSDLTDINKRMDGLLPQLLSKTKALTAIFNLILSDANETDELMQAIEQITTTIRTTQGEMNRLLAADPNKKYVYPKWMFVEGVPSSTDEFGVCQEFTGGRSEDLIFDDLVDALVGQDSIIDTDGNEINEGYGIAHAPDDVKTTDGKPDFDNENWKDFEEGYEDLVNLIYKESPYSLVESLITVTESFLGDGHMYSDAQISGLLYSVGKLFTYYDADGGRWVYQGEEGFNRLFNILAETLPDIHDILKDEPIVENGQAIYGANNDWDLLTMVSALLKKKGVLDDVIDTVTIDAKWSQVFTDIDTFLNQEFISNDEPLWSTTAQLLLDVATAMDESQDIDLYSIYRDYGFQLN